MLVEAGGERDLAAQVRGLHLEARELVVLRPRVVHVVGVDDVGLAGLDAGRQQPDPERAGRQGPHRRAVLGRGERPHVVGLDGAHEGVADEDAVVQVERLAVRIAAGGAADLDELLDLRMADRQVDRRRAAAQRALADGERQAVHHADEGHDAGGLAVLADLLAERAQVAPVGADAAALGGQPDILVPEADDGFEAVIGLVQEAADRQPACRTPVRQHRRGRHEPELADVVVEPLRMRGVVAIGRGHPREEILVGLSGQQVAVVERGAAEIGEHGIAAAIHLHLMMALKLNCVEHGQIPSIPRSEHASVDRGYQQAR
jgi:hypothetical protein